MPKIGMTFTNETVVTLSNCAVTMESGDLEVFATPAMVSLMENAAMNAVALVLPQGSTTVGAEMNTTHIKPSPIGAQVKATARLVAVDGGKLSFDIEASDECGIIGKAHHVRFVVDRERFMSKLK